MAKRKTSIQINGSHYDALTGALLSFELAPVKAGKSIDGVIGGSHKPTVTLAAPVMAPKAQPIKPGTKPRFKPDVTRSTAAHAQTHQTKPSATLMRHVVAKPTHKSLKRTGNVRAAHHPASRVTLASHVMVVPKLSMHSINQQRADRAAAIAMSPRIDRFARQTVFRIERDVEQVLAAADKALVIPQDAPVRVTVSPRSTDIFEQALLRANTHEISPPVANTKRGRKLRRRMISASVSAVLAVSVIGAIGYHNDSVQLKLASHQAGFSATVPTYQPTGFEMADVQSGTGYVNMHFKHKDRNWNYAVSEKPTSWDSQTLLNKLTTSNRPYNTVQHADRLIYTYGNNEAAWVNQGILYHVTSNAPLAANDLTQIAASM